MLFSKLNVLLLQFIATFNVELCMNTAFNQYYSVSVENYAILISSKCTIRMMINLFSSFLH